MTDDDNIDEKFNHLLDRSGALLTTVLEAVEAVDPTVVRHVAGIESFEGLEVHSFEEEDPTVDDLNEIWVNTPASLFFAQRVSWTDKPEPEPGRDSWLVIVVIPDKPVIFFCKNLEDELWSPFPVTKAPWFAVSTAHGMRQAQADGKPLPPIRVASDKKELFMTPEELLLPPVDSDGIVG